MDNGEIGVTIAIGFSLFILYTRKKKWMKEKIVWLICIGLLTIGIYGFLFLKPTLRTDKALYLGLCIPTVYWIFDRIFKRISENIHKRDFILFLRYSDEINDGMGAKNPHVKTSDKIFTFGLLIITIVTLVIGLETI